MVKFNIDAKTDYEIFGIPKELYDKVKNKEIKTHDVEGKYYRNFTFFTLASVMSEKGQAEIAVLMIVLSHLTGVAMKNPIDVFEYLDKSIEDDKELMSLIIQIIESIEHFSKK